MTDLVLRHRQKKGCLITLSLVPHQPCQTSLIAPFGSMHETLSASPPEAIFLNRGVKIVSMLKGGSAVILILTQNIVIRRHRERHWRTPKPQL